MKPSLRIFDGLAGLLILAQSVLYLYGGQIHVDEGTYLAVASLWWQGFEPYADFFYLQMPLYPMVAGSAVGLLGQSLFVVRWLSLVSTVAGIAFLWDALRRRDRLAATLLLVLWACSPFQLYFGIIARIFGMSIGLIGLSIWLHERGRGGERAISWDCAALAAFSLAVATRLTVLPGLAGGWCVLVWQHRRRPLRLVALTLAAALPAALLVAPAYLRDAEAAWFGMLGFHLMLTAGDGSALGMRARMILILLQGYVLFVVGWLVVFAVGVGRLWRGAGAPGYALGVSVGLFLVHFVPAQTQPAYQTVTFPPAAFVLSLLLAAWTRSMPSVATSEPAAEGVDPRFGSLFFHTRQRKPQAETASQREPSAVGPSRDRSRTRALLLGMGGVGALGLAVFGTTRLSLGPEGDGPYGLGHDRGLLQRQAATLAEHVPPDGLVVSSDTPLVPMQARRRLHPSFVSNEYFPLWDRETCERFHVVNDTILHELFTSGEVDAILLGSLSYTIGFPEMLSISPARREALLAVVREHYRLVATTDNLYIPGTESFVYVRRTEPGTDASP